MSISAVLSITVNLWQPRGISSFWYFTKHHKESGIISAGYVPLFIISSCKNIHLYLISILQNSSTSKWTRWMGWENSSLHNITGISITRYFQTSFSLFRIYYAIEVPFQSTNFASILCMSYFASKVVLYVCCVFQAELLISILRWLIIVKNN